MKNCQISTYETCAFFNRNQKTVGATTSSNSGDKTFSAPTLDWVPDPNEPTYCLCNQVIDLKIKLFNYIFYWGEKIKILIELTSTFNPSILQDI